MSDKATPTRETLKAEPRPPVVPNRFRSPLFRVVEDFMPATFDGLLGEWLHNRKALFARGGDELGADRFRFELAELENIDDAQTFLAAFKAKLIEAVADTDSIAVPAFDLRYLETWATLHHHGSHENWHDDALDYYSGDVVPSRRVAFSYFAHSEPKMFDGGELEFLDGTKLTPKANRLVVYHPLQQHRVARVSCWSSAFLHGRWALQGWVHGDAPEGWLDRLPELRGVPR